MAMGCISHVWQQLFTESELVLPVANYLRLIEDLLQQLLLDMIQEAAVHARCPRADRWGTVRMGQQCKVS